MWLARSSSIFWGGEASRTTTTGVLRSAGGFFVKCRFYRGKKKTTNLSLVEGRGATLLDLGALLGSLLDTLGEESLVLDLGLLGVLGTTLLEVQDVALALKNNGSDKTLDLGGLGVGLLLSVLGLNLATDNELADIILLGQVLYIGIGIFQKC